MRTEYEEQRTRFFFIWIFYQKKVDKKAKICGEALEREYFKEVWR